MNEISDEQHALFIRQLTGMTSKYKFKWSKNTHLLTYFISLIGTVNLLWLNILKM